MRSAPLHGRMTTRRRLRTLITASRASSSEDEETKMEMMMRNKNGGFVRITSLSNGMVKRVVKLRTGSASARGEEGVAVLTSELALRDAHRAAAAGNGRIGIALLFLNEESGLLDDDDDDDDDMRALMEDARQLVMVSPNVLKKLTGLESVNSKSLCAVVEMPQRVSSSSSSSSSSLGDCWKGQVDKVLVLDAVQDPGNLGTLLRAAAAFGWCHVVLLQGCCDPFNDKAIRAGRGAQWALAPLGVGVHWEDLQKVIQQHRLRLVAADARGEDIQDFVSTQSCASGRWCLVLGSEGQGLSSTTRAQPGLSLVSIDMESSVESLNVACAGSILMHAMR